jgi:allantoate deiminase
VSLSHDLQAASRFGAVPGGGVTRPAWSDELADVTEWVASELAGLGLDTEVDAAGNLIARWPAGDGLAVMVGSHLDTVPDGGRFDGALGVLAALDAVRTLKRSGLRPRRPIWVAAFMDEEGARFGTALFGSRAFAGHDLSSELSATDRDGIRLDAAIAARGHDPRRLPEARRIDEVGAYLELHVEQGSILDERGLRVGIVESIAGIMSFHVTVSGEANHAGTTPADRRRDALVGAARMVLAIRDLAAAEADVRSTVGTIEVAPGASNVIPGCCEFSVDLRVARRELVESQSRRLATLVAEIAADEGLAAEVAQRYAIPPVPMHDSVLSVLRAAASELGVDLLPMWSGAGHDAMVIGAHVPAGMLFVPSRGGISHSPHEHTDAGDCELGARVLTAAIRRLAF